jgi:23S rRNA (cytosine1962-C5)-methyltransferase
VFAQLQAYRQAGRRFGLVIVDPPSFAKSSGEHGRALQAYAQLVQLALPCVEQNGIFVIASCSSRVSEGEWLATIHTSAAQLGRPLRTQLVTAHALDHPVLPSFPEGRYLKCLFARPTD